MKHNLSPSPRCTFRYPTEHIKQDSKSMTFRDFIQMQQTKDEMKFQYTGRLSPFQGSPINSKKERWEKQLSTLLFQDQQNELYIKHSSQCQIAVKDFEKKTKNFRSQEQSPIKTAYQLPIIGDSQDIVLPNTPVHFKFTPIQPKTKAQNCIGLRNVQDQLEQLKKPKIQASHRELKQQPMTQTEIISKFFETKFQRIIKTQIKQYGSNEQLDQHSETLYSRIILDRQLKMKFQGKSLKYLKDIYKSILGIGYNQKMMYLFTVELRKIFDFPSINNIHPLIQKKIQFQRCLINLQKIEETPTKTLVKCHFSKNQQKHFKIPSQNEKLICSNKSNIVSPHKKKQ